MSSIFEMFQEKVHDMNQADVYNENLVTVSVRLTEEERNIADYLAKNLKESRQSILHEIIETGLKEALFGYLKASDVSQDDYYKIVTSLSGIEPKKDEDQEELPLKEGN